MSRIAELIKTEPEDAIVGLVMQLTGGSANPAVVRAQIARAKLFPSGAARQVSADVGAVVGSARKTRTENDRQ